MRDLLSELYNKVLNFFQPAERGEASKDIASNRLKLVLMQDRTNLDSSTLEKMRIELVDVISKYVEIDTEEFNVNLEGVGDSIALMLNIPVIRAKTPEEIEAATAAKEQEEEQEEENQQGEDEVKEDTTEASQDSEVNEETEAPAEEKTEEEVNKEEKKETKTKNSAN